jgi:threonine/homoserine/homoserine lactone efflux protein
MPDFSRFLIFFTAAIFLAVAPGPGMLYVLARTLAGGRREGLLSALGTFFGGMVHVFAAAAGISIILAKSAIAFATVKYLGAAYLCFLGIRMILDARRDSSVETQLAASPAGKDLESAKATKPLAHELGALKNSGLPRSRNPLWQGVLTEVLNPKTALFFLSFIPQFVNHTLGHVFEQFIVLGAISVTLNTTADILVTLFASPLGRRIRESARFRRRQRTLTGAVMIGLGTYLALGESK